MDALSKIANGMEEAPDKWKEHPLFYLLEPYGVGKRSPEVYEQALKDGVDLQSPDLVRCVGGDPHPYQDGYLLSEKFCRVLLGPNQGGKSLMVFIDILIRATGQIPYALRYPKGHDTGIPRLITPENIYRFGRRDIKTGEIIDHDRSVRQDGTWDCGNVTGVGVYPQSKIVPQNSMIRLASRRQQVNQVWWPAFAQGIGALSKFLHPLFIDRARGAHNAKGANKQSMQVYLLRGVTLQVLAYDAGKEIFEGAKVPTYLDEEPDDEDVVSAVITHCTDWSLSETPYQGITYTKEIAFPKQKTATKETFHATAYDCPYKDKEDVRHMREEVESRPWEIAARLWGIPADQSSAYPYYDRQKINFWIQKFSDKLRQVRYVTFEPKEMYDGIVSDPWRTRPGLLDVDVRMLDAQEENQQTVWKLYEDRQAGRGYCIASDQAEGAETPEEAGDFSTAMIGRASDRDPHTPVLCASLRSTLPTPQFAMEVLLAARYFNNSLICPENGRGSSNATFWAESRDWPYWLRDVVIKQATRKQTEQLGFCPTTDRRETVFDRLIRKWLDSYESEDYPNIPDEDVLREAAAAIRVKKKNGEAKCDHTTQGTLDSLMAFGILLYVFDGFDMQVTCNAGEDKGDRPMSWLDAGLQAKVRAQSRPRFLGENIKPTR